MELNLNDLEPQEAEFELSTMPGVKHRLKIISLRVQIWLDERYGVGKIKDIFENQNMKEISEICFYLLKDKSPFKGENGIPCEEALQEAITLKDKTVVFMALLTSIGLSQPVIDKFAKDYDQAQKKSLIGDSITMSSQASTDTV